MAFVQNLNMLQVPKHMSFSRITEAVQSKGFFKPEQIANK